MKRIDRQNAHWMRESESRTTVQIWRRLEPKIITLSRFLVVSQVQACSTERRRNK